MSYHVDILLSSLKFEIFVSLRNFPTITSKVAKPPQNKFIGDGVMQNSRLFWNTPY